VSGSDVVERFRVSNSSAVATSPFCWDFCSGIWAGICIYQVSVEGFRVFDFGIQSVSAGKDCVARKVWNTWKKIRGRSFKGIIIIIYAHGGGHSQMDIALRWEWKKVLCHDVFTVNSH
jgi:hypothetical protein